ncbi:hypothetical protein CLOHYLEM_06921 [[Clostridium] hylemonae DSM 15053]|uniref:Uncharacterized protein n=1 Tax=[Clostridium] hylemonae DSM 15053 TaxID=553973 RepID=C0C4A6_9FIRM|nr:hypothetical protein CLOHYLEM_06921 [[Clostridium] hylemonae DSM 15053]
MKKSQSLKDKKTKYKHCAQKAGYNNMKNKQLTTPGIWFYTICSYRKRFSEKSNQRGRRTARVVLLFFFCVYGTLHRVALPYLFQ